MAGYRGALERRGTETLRDRRTHRQQIQPLAFDGRGSQGLLRPRFGGEILLLLETERGQLSLHQTLGPTSERHFFSQMLPVEGKPGPTAELPDVLKRFHPGFGPQFESIVENNRLLSRLFSIFDSYTDSNPQRNRLKRLAPPAGASFSPSRTVRPHR